MSLYVYIRIYKTIFIYIYIYVYIYICIYIYISLSLSVFLPDWIMLNPMFWCFRRLFSMVKRLYFWWLTLHFGWFIGQPHIFVGKIDSIEDWTHIFGKQILLWLLKSTFFMVPPMFFMGFAGPQTHPMPKRARPGHARGRCWGRHGAGQGGQGLWPGAAAASFYILLVVDDGYSVEIIIFHG